jgi:hypothetical protein
MRKYLLGIFFVLIPFMVMAQPTKTIVLESTWSAPTTNADGTPITDLQGYHMCISLNPIPADLTVDQMSTVCLVSLDIPDAVQESSLDEVILNVPTAGTIYVRVNAYDTSGNQSVFSDEASVAYDFMPPDGKTISVTLKATVKS